MLWLEKIPRAISYCSRSELDCYPRAVWSKNQPWLVGPQKKKERERENWRTTKLLFKTCIKTIFTCKKIKENFFWTGSREDRSQRERRSTRFALVKACFLKMCSKISKKIWSGTTELRSEIFKRKKNCGLFCALAILQS